MSIYDLKPKFQVLLRPIVARLYELGISANQVTIAAVLLSIVYGAAIGLSGGERWVLAFLPIVLFVRMALNAIDGMLAREFEMASKTGAMLNELGDVVSDAALYLPFMFVNGIDELLVALFVVIGIISEFAGVMADVLGSERRYDGPMGKSDRAFVMGLIALLLAVGVKASIWINAILALAILLGAVTVYNRAKHGIT